AVPLANPYLTSPITLAMLLEHTAGLKDLSRKEFNYPSPLSLKRAFQVEPNARKVLWEPGNFKSYSNAGAGYVSAAIEQITQKDYDQWFNKSILAQMGMHNSQLNWSEKLEQSLVSGYDADLKTAIPYWHTLYRAFGNLNTNANDMAKFLLLLINKGTIDGKIIFRASSIQRMETPMTSLAARQGLALGYGLGIRNELYEGHRLYQHGGDADGYLAHFAYNKDSRRGYFIVINAFRHDILAEFKSGLNDWLIENLAPPKLLPTAKLRPEHLQTLAGTYSPATYRFSPKQGQAIEIRMDKNTLYIATGDHGDGVKLIPVSKWLFRKSDEPEASVAFVLTADGKLNMHNDSGAFQKQ
ncbi:MAG: CubicO group peptidase (beta-lactamase class C family), partial [Paraglaciecola sp.]